MNGPIVDPGFQTPDSHNRFATPFPEACLACLESGDPYRSPEPGLPAEGTLIVCAGCGAIHIVVPDGMRLATQAEVDDYDNQAQG